MNHFTLEERKMLADLLKDWVPYREISLIVNKSISSISDEKRRNSVLKDIKIIEDGKIFTEKRLFYDPYIAHRKASIREINKWKNKRSKLEISSWLKKFVVDKLESEQWSPEQISGHLRNESVLKSKDWLWKTVISHETIYQFIYSKEGNELKLWQNLRHNHSNLKWSRKSRWERNKRRNKVRIPNRTSIHSRLDIVNERKRFWDYEWDLMIFSNSPKTLAVFVERKTRKIYARVNDNKTASEMEWALSYLVESVWQINLKTITFDNWTENICHEKVRKDYNYSFETFFCDPYCSRQKWAVENANKLLRQYFNRKMKDEDITQDYLDNALKKINNRPRKTLWFRSAEKEFTRNLFCSV